MNKNEKLEKYDMLDCIEFAGKCPQCSNNIKINLTEFKSVNLKFGLVYTCPCCSADFHIKKIELEGNKR